MVLLSPLYFIIIVTIFYSFILKSCYYVLTFGCFRCASISCLFREPHLSRRSGLGPADTRVSCCTLIPGSTSTNLDFQLRHRRYACFALIIDRSYGRFVFLAEANAIDINVDSLFVVVFYLMRYRLCTCLPSDNAARTSSQLSCCLFSIFFVMFTSIPLHPGVSLMFASSFHVQQQN